MSMLISSLKRRNEALQAECDTLAQGVDNLSAKLQEAYQLLQRHEPAWVAEQLGLTAPPAEPAIEPAAAPSHETPIDPAKIVAGSISAKARKRSAPGPA